MKITSFNPLVLSTDPESNIKLFEQLGFERVHEKEGLDGRDIKEVRMRDARGFHVDVATTLVLPQDKVLIRMNVDDINEAIELLKAHGFKRAEQMDRIVETGSSTFVIMVSPTRYAFALSEHHKD